MSHLAVILAYAVITMAAFLLPVCIFALKYKEDDPRIRATRQNEAAHYHPSLTRFTQLTRLNIGGMVFVLAVLFIRLAFRYDQIAPTLPPQPTWSVVLSTVSSMVLIVMLAGPVFHLISLKYEITSKEENQ